MDKEGTMEHANIAFGLGKIEEKFDYSKILGDAEIHDGYEFVVRV